MEIDKEKFWIVLGLVDFLVYLIQIKKFTTDQKFVVVLNWHISNYSKQGSIIKNETYWYQNQEDKDIEY